MLPSEPFTVNSSRDEQIIDYNWQVDSGSRLRDAGDNVVKGSAVLNAQAGLDMHAVLQTFLPKSAALAWKALQQLTPKTQKPVLQKADLA